MGLVHTTRTAQTNLGKKWAVPAFPRCSRQKKDNHEQDAEQDRNQHDRGRKSFHVPNVTPSKADWFMPILLAPGARRHPATHALRGCSRALLAGLKPAPTSGLQVAAGREWRDFARGMRAVLGPGAAKEFG